jgi:hypothetical protein
VSDFSARLLEIHDALARAGIPHAIGGAVALGYCTRVPREPRDLDLNVFVAPARLGEVLAALPEELATGAASPAREGELAAQLAREGKVTLHWGETAVDLFFDVLDFHAVLAAGVREVPFMGRTIPVVGCMAIAVFKATFDRPHHWADVEEMVAAASLDVYEAAAWVRELEGADSEKARRLEALRA